jgi:hypothetical protein
MNIWNISGILCNAVSSLMISATIYRMDTSRDADDLNLNISKIKITETKT